MLDVHPPNTKMHGVADFFLHLFTITVGLLIALALEGLVERHHKAEVRREAESNLRQEIEDNRKAIQQRLPVMEQEKKTLVTLLQFADARRHHQPFDVSKMTLGFTNSTLNDASWRTAGATGALALMDYNTAQRYSNVYQLQQQTMRLEQQTLDDFLVIESHSVFGFDPAKISDAEIAEGEPEVRHALVHLVAWQQFSQGLSEVYDRALAAGK